MKHTTRWALVLAAAAAPAAAQAPRSEAPRSEAPRPEGPRTFDARPTTAPITPQDLRTHVYVLAADSMMGREIGSRGHAQGTQYIADQLRRMGVQPAGEDGYFQTLPLMEMGLEPGARLEVGMHTLAQGTDFIPVPSASGVLNFGTTLSASGVAVVYGGRVGDPAAMISPEQAAGKLVVFDAPLTPNGRPGFAFWAGGQSYERYAGAAGLAFATLDQTSPAVRGFFQSTRMEVQHGGETGPRVPPAIIVTRAVAERLMGGPLAARQVGAAGGTASGSFAFFTRPAPFPARNVIAVIPGRDPSLRGEYVAIGAHSDHVGTAEQPLDHDSLLVFNRLLRAEGADQEPGSMTAEVQAEMARELAVRRAAGPARLDSIYNGADDDASGTAGLLELAQHFLANPPRRSVLLVWHTGEESGMYGSEWFTDHPTVPRESIVAQLNLDMIGRGGAGDVRSGGPAYLELVGSRRLSTQLGDLVEEVNRTGGFGFRFDYTMDTPGHAQQIYCRSDHASYARYGIPVTFFTTGGHSDYHMLTDEPQYVDYDKAANVSRLIAAVAQELGNRDARPVVDKPVTGPDAPCQQ